MIDLRCGDCLEVMRTLPDNSVHACVTDPPYGLSFMGKKWDYDVPAEDVWREVLRILKPGGFLLSFSGTRTYHRMTVRIEDAGFEIRDMIQWLYGSGFPKSHDISKAIDKEAGAEREVIGQHERSNLRKNGAGFRNLPSLADESRGAIELTAPATAAAKQWEGWGTALKPAQETVLVAIKPNPEYAIIGSCLSKLYANIAAQLSASSRKELREACGSVPRLAERLNAIPVGSSGRTATWQLDVDLTSCLSIVQSWRNIWGENSDDESTSIMLTALSTIIDLKTLSSLVSQITPDCIIQAVKNPHGPNTLVALVAESFSAVYGKLNVTRILSALGPVTSNGRTSFLDAGVHPHCEPICVARKPLIGTVAANVLAHGCGGLNIDACRVGFASEDDKAAAAAAAQRSTRDQNANRSTFGEFNNGEASLAPYLARMDKGRWPANVVHDGSDEACAGMGESSRYFYSAKADRAEREKGLAGGKQAGGSNAKGYTADVANGLDRNRPVRNYHPTVKPIDLMRWLVRLVCPPDGVVLDPYTGSGTTGVACRLEGFGFIGIELNPEYIELARQRINAETPSLFGPEP